MNNLFVLIKKDLLEQVRTKKLLIIGILFLFVAIASPITAKLLPLILKSVQVPGLIVNLPDPSYMDSLDQFIKNISQLGVFILIFVVAGAITEEKTTKTIEIVLTKPISRSNFVVSKFLSNILSVSALCTAGSLVFYLYTWSTFGAFSFANFSLVGICVLLYILMIISVTLFASSFARSTVAAAGFGLFVMIIIVPLLGLFNAIKDYSPNILIGAYKDIMLNGYQDALTKPIGIALIVIAASVLLAVTLFNNQEIER